MSHTPKGDDFYIMQLKQDMLKYLEEGNTRGLRDCIIELYGNEKLEKQTKRKDSPVRVAYETMIVKLLESNRFSDDYTEKAMADLAQLAMTDPFMSSDNKKDLYRGIDQRITHYPMVQFNARKVLNESPEYVCDVVDNTLLKFGVKDANDDDKPPTLNDTVDLTLEAIDFIKDMYQTSNDPVGLLQKAINTYIDTAKYHLKRRGKETSDVRYSILDDFEKELKPLLEDELRNQEKREKEKYEASKTQRGKKTNLLFNFLFNGNGKK